MINLDVTFHSLEVLLKKKTKSNFLKLGHLFHQLECLSCAVLSLRIKLPDGPSRELVDDLDISWSNDSFFLSTAYVETPSLR